MEILIFIYNIFLIVLYTVVLTFSVINYRHKKKPLFLAAALLFLFYIFDNIIIYMTEFLDGFSAHYNLQFMTAPAFKTLVFLTTSFCLVSIQSLALPGRKRKGDTAALILLGLSLLFIPMAGNGAFKVWLYYLPPQLFTLYLSVSGLLYLKKHPETLDQEMSSYKSLLWITAVFSLLILIEDTIVIFSFDIYSDILVKINNRSISEDIMSIIYSVYAVGYLTKQLQTPSLAECTSMKDPSPGDNFCNEGHSPTLPPDLAEPLPKTSNQWPEDNTAFLHFVNHYQLTSREQEILRILLKDKNNQEISEALFISIGTVKTHVHNIFQKVNVTKRSQLLRTYYEYQKDRPWK